jgi:hypothetical protein
LYYLKLLLSVPINDNFFCNSTVKTCTPENFEVVSREGGNGILPGSKIAGIMRAASGCTNAALLAAVNKIYDIEEGAMAVVGSCPSVGITGYLLGGGQGDITPVRI